MNMMRVWDVEDIEEHRALGTFYTEEDAEDYADYMATIGRCVKVCIARRPTIAEYEPRIRTW